MRKDDALRKFDEHASCKEALERAYQSIGDGARIKQVVLRDKDGTHRILNVLRVDAFQDGLRVLVQ